MPSHQVERLDSGAEPAWRAIAELTLPAAAGRAQSAVVQVAAAVQDVDLSPTRLEQLTRAVSEAVHNAAVQEYRFQTELPLQISVFVSELDDQRAVCSWGFFLIARTADRLHVGNGPAHHTIELFLYQESAQA